MPKATEKGPTYHLDEPVHAQLVDHLRERFECHFPAGAHVPKSEQEQIALEHLFVSGLATKDGAWFEAADEGNAPVSRPPAAEDVPRVVASDEQAGLPAEGSAEEVGS